MFLNASLLLVVEQWGHFPPLLRAIPLVYVLQIRSASQSTSAGIISLKPRLCCCWHGLKTLSAVSPQIADAVLLKSVKKSKAN